MSIRTAKLLWMFLGLTPIAEAVTSGADETAIAGGVIYVLGSLALHRAGRRDPHGSVLRAFAGTRIALVATIGVILVVQLVAGLVSGRAVLVTIMGLGFGLIVLWARSRTVRELTARVGGILLLSATLALVGIVGEVAMILLEPYLFKGFYEYDPELGFRARAYQPTPGGVTNKFGFNDRDYPEQKPRGVFRILVLGDSFSWAGGGDGNYTALLEQKFENHYGHHRVDVINAGYSGTHTGQQLAMLEKYGLQYNPDLVVLGFYVGNDFLDANPNSKRIVLNDTFIRIDPLKERRLFGYPIIPQSRLLLFLEQKWKIAAEMWKAEAESGGHRQPPGIESPARPGRAAPSNSLRPRVSPGAISVVVGPSGRIAAQGGAGLDPPRDEASVADRGRRRSGGPPEQGDGFFSEETFLDVERARLRFFNVGPSRDERLQRNINYVLKSIEKMDAILKPRNAKLVVAIYPDEFQVDKELFRKVIRRFNLSEKDYDVRLAQNILKAFLDRKSIKYIDLTDRFAAEAERADLYLLRNTHWNRAGNQLASDILFENLTKYLGF